MEREHVFCSEPGPRVRLRLYLDAEQNVTFVLIDLELIGLDVVERDPVVLPRPLAFWQVGRVLTGQVLPRLVRSQVPVSGERFLLF